VASVAGVLLEEEEEEEEVAVAPPLVCAPKRRSSCTTESWRAEGARTAAVSSLSLFTPSSFCAHIIPKIIKRSD
jgi:hypothetical protein